MNQPSLPPQGRYNDPRIQQLVVDELRRNDITPEKFYFTSDDWMVSYDGQVPAWNSVFGVAPYRKDGQTYYAECGVSQRFDAATAQWSEPAATIKAGLPLGEPDFDAAPGALSGGGAPGAATGDASGGTNTAADASSPVDSSSTILAASVPNLDGQAPPQTDEPDSGLAGFAVPASENEQAAQVATQPADDQPEPESAPEPADADVAAGTPDFSGSESAQPDVLPSSSQTGPRHAAIGDEPEVGSAVDSQSESPYDGDTEHRPDDTDTNDAPNSATHGDTNASVDDSLDEPIGPGGGSAVYGGDAINSREPAYDVASVPASEGQANVAGYSLRVNEDGTAELRVPLGGQVTLRWAEQ